LRFRPPGRPTAERLLRLGVRDRSEPCCAWSRDRSGSDNPGMRLYHRARALGSLRPGARGLTHQRMTVAPAPAGARPGTGKRRGFLSVARMPPPKPGSSSGGLVRHDAASGRVHDDIVASPAGVHVSKHESRDPGWEHRRERRLEAVLAPAEPGVSVYDLLKKA